MTKGQATRARLIDAAHRLAIRQGFDRTSVNDVMDAANVKKGAFYYHFPDKDSLILAVLERDSAQFLSRLEDSLKSDTPLQSLEIFFARALRSHAERGFVGGCLWGNTALEMSDSHPVFAAFVANVFSEWQHRIEAVLRAGQECGDIRRDLSSEALARAVIATVEGGIMLSRLTKQEGPMEQCLSAMRTMLEPVS